jgi:uncharacterized membrane protein (Fun14 family)
LFQSSRTESSCSTANTGSIPGYELKKSNEISAIIVGIFIAALAFLEYHRIIQVDWTSFQADLQSEITWLTNAVIHISNNIAVNHLFLGTSNVTLASSTSI